MAGSISLDIYAAANHLLCRREQQHGRIRRQTPWRNRTIQRRGRTSTGTGGRRTTKKEEEKKDNDNNDVAAPAHARAAPFKVRATHSHSCYAVLPASCSQGFPTNLPGGTGASTRHHDQPSSLLLSFLHNSQQYLATKRRASDQPPAATAFVSSAALFKRVRFCMAWMDVGSNPIPYDCATDHRPIQPRSGSKPPSSPPSTAHQTRA